MWAAAWDPQRVQFCTTTSMVSNADWQSYVKEADACPWLTPTTVANQLQCRDGSFCMGRHGAGSGSWGCCDQRGKRAKCPPNLPNMCAQPRASFGRTDFSCEESCDSMGGIRPCPGGEASAEFGFCSGHTRHGSGITGTCTDECWKRPYGSYPQKTPSSDWCHPQIGSWCFCTADGSPCDAGHCGNCRTEEECPRACRWADGACQTRSASALVGGCVAPSELLDARDFAGLRRWESCVSPLACKRAAPAPRQCPRPRGAAGRAEVLLSSGRDGGLLGRASRQCCARPADMPARPRLAGEGGLSYDLRDSPRSALSRRFLGMCRSAASEQTSLDDAAYVGCSINSAELSVPMCAKAAQTKHPDQHKISAAVCSDTLVSANSHPTISVSSTGCSGVAAGEQNCCKNGMSDPRPVRDLLPQPRRLHRLLVLQQRPLLPQGLLERQREPRHRGRRLLLHAVPARGGMPCPVPRAALHALRHLPRRHSDTLPVPPRCAHYNGQPLAERVRREARRHGCVQECGDGVTAPSSVLVPAW